MIYPHAEIDGILKRLRQLRPARKPVEFAPRTVGERLADAVASKMGSWNFILIQAGLLVIWIVLNVLSWVHKWDPYPFILLNLALSFQAAFTAPILMMSQNRQSAIDRQRAENDYAVNCKAELEIEALHAKIDKLREEEITQLIAIIRDLEKKLGK